MPTKMTLARFVIMMTIMLMTMTTIVISDVDDGTFMMLTVLAL